MDHHEDLEKLDPLHVGDKTGVTASVWRSWSKHASPELLEAFNKRSLGAIKAARSQFPSNIDPTMPEYRNMRRACVNALNRLSETVQGEHDALD